jgi:protein TonB
METKKSPKANLESKRLMFTQIGLVSALLLCIIMIEWKTYEKSISSLGDLDILIEDEIIPPTQREQKPPPPPPAAPEIIQVVENDVELEEELTMESAETDQDEEIEVVEAEEEDTEEILNFAIVENKPAFPGCEDEKTEEAKAMCFQKKMQEHVAKNFVFPEMARQMGISGKIFVNFVIEKDGSISNVAVARGVDKSLDEEAIRVIKKLPKMQPARQRGKPVRMQFTMPINARLQ